MAYYWTAEPHNIAYVRTIIGWVRSPDMLLRSFNSLSIDQRAAAVWEIIERVPLVGEGPEGILQAEAVLHDVLGPHRLRAPEVALYATTLFDSLHASQEDIGSSCYVRSPSGRDFGIYGAGEKDDDGNRNHYGTWEVVELLDPTGSNGLYDSRETVACIRSFYADGYAPEPGARYITLHPLRYQYCDLRVRFQYGDEAWDVTPLGPLRETLATALHDFVRELDS